MSIRRRVGTSIVFTYPISSRFRATSSSRTKRPLGPVSPILGFQPSYQPHPSSCPRALMRPRVHGLTWPQNCSSPRNSASPTAEFPSKQISTPSGWWSMKCLLDAPPSEGVDIGKQKSYGTSWRVEGQASPKGQGILALMEVHGNWFKNVGTKIGLNDPQLKRFSNISTAWQEIRRLSLLDPQYLLARLETQCPPNLIVALELLVSIFLTSCAPHQTSPRTISPARLFAPPQTSTTII